MQQRAISSPRRENGTGRRTLESVLRMIWEERRISRSDIARRAELSRSTVSEVVSTLLSTGLVAEVGTAPSRGGRRPIVLEFQDRAFGILGVEIGAAHVAAALTDLRGRVLTWNEEPHPVRDDPEGTRELVAHLCDRSLAQWGHSARSLLGIGVAMPAPVDQSRSDRLSEIVLPKWKGKSGLDFLESIYRVPVRVDNDANLGALAERWWSEDAGVDDLAYIKVATGVGSGHIIDGKIYRGSTGFAGEIGHMAIDPQGEPCICGLRGCLATLVGREALLRRARELSVDRPGSRLAATHTTMHDLEDAALAGEEVALRVVHEAAEHLGTALSGLLNLMNPGVIVLGGDLASLGDLLLGPLRENIRSRTLVNSVSAARVRASDLGPRSVAVGAATMILDAAMKDLSLFPGAAARRTAP